MPRYLDFEITLVLSRRVWRRFLIRKAASFHELHLAIQDAFGWQNYHLFEFRNPGAHATVVAGLPDEDAPDTPDARSIQVKDRMSSYAYFGSTWFEYEYDFGDGWIHEVKLRGEVSLPDTFRRRLLDGERAAPPEDCGGPGAYDRIVSVVETGKDPWDQLATIREWLGPWQPERLDLDALREQFDRPSADKKPSPSAHH